MTRWYPLVSEETCEFCERLEGEEHRRGCEVGAEILAECLRDEAIERAIDEAKEVA